MVAGFGLVAFASAPGIATSAEYETSNRHLNMDALIDALRSIGKPICLDAAEKLQGLVENSGSFDLHLRRAGLDAEDAMLLAEAMREKPGSYNVTLRSFSASYNPNLTDEGVIALANAFPTTMTGLGLVGCSIGDPGGLAILGWAENAESPRMICIEANAFSAKVRSRILAFGQKRKSLFLIA